MSSSALIGYTGFVGGNLKEQHSFDFLYNSKNIEDIRGKSFDLLVCAGAPGGKRIANKEPESDLATIARLMENLGTVSAKKCILISTVDVYATPQRVDEDTMIDGNALPPYGKHRFHLEEYMQKTFDSLTVRLPGIFGNGLKKNAIYDFMQGGPTFINDESVLQFYPLSHLWSDITEALKQNIKVINLVTEPVTIHELAKEVFGLEYQNRNEPPSFYDIHTKYANLWGGTKPYLYEKSQVFEELKQFVQHHKN